MRDVKVKLRSDLNIISYDCLRTILEPSLQLEPKFLTAPKSTKSQSSPLKIILWRDEAAFLLIDCFLDLPWFWNEAFKSKPCAFQLNEPVLRDLYLI